VVFYTRILFLSIVFFYVFLLCKCVLCYCHRLSTQLQLNISYHIVSKVPSFWCCISQYCLTTCVTVKEKKCTYIVTYNAPYSCPILTKFGFSRQILMTVSNTKLHGSQPEGSELLCVNGRTVGYVDAHKRFWELKAKSVCN
jgi:hypothetical protein